MYRETVMPNIKSAAKRMRQTVKRTARNRVRKEKLKKALKTFKSAVRKAETNSEAAQAIADGLKVVTKAVDKAGTKGTLHKNAVNRRKSRLAKAANRVAKKA